MDTQFGLAPYACHPNESRGRRYPEDPAPTRTPFQRDRDRIVHSTAFRRLVYKTQVFLNHEGDLFRTRLTHSIEVAQLARSIARALRINEDLVEAIALAHDLGHTPFGHAGQDALHECMRHWGGFEHNFQSLRVVDELEERYPGYDGLNLSFETREGILKHCSKANAQRLELLEPMGVASRFLANGQPSLEAQLCNLADEIAYNAHDIDDGVRSGLISMQQLANVPLVQTYQQSALAEHPHLSESPRRLLYETIRCMLSAQVYDVIAHTTAALADRKPSCVQDVRESRPLVGFSADMARQSRELKQFLFRELYRHPQVVQTTQTAQRMVSELFQVYQSDPDGMQAGYTARFLSAAVGDDEAQSQAKKRRVVADYIAGMTDRFAAKEHVRLTGVQLTFQPAVHS